MKQQSHSGGERSVRGLFSWLRRRLKVNKIERATGTRVGNSTNICVSNPWHAVAISSGQACCHASVAARNIRFLSQEAPPLPLSGCTQPKSCMCKYKHYTDRRAGPRRVTDSHRFKNAVSRPVMAKLTIKDRRASVGRRITDAR